LSSLRRDKVHVSSRSFAKSAIAQGYVRPEFLDVLAVKAGRHAILERFHANDEEFVPNDVYCSETSSFHIVSGPNMSGEFERRVVTFG
jgi:DNA mismatch repair protein MSH4